MCHIFCFEKEVMAIILPPAPSILEGEIDDASSLALLLVDESFVGSCIHQALELALVAELNLDDPVLKSVLVDQARLVFKGFVNLNNSAAHGAYQVAGSLHALYCA